MNKTIKFFIKEENYKERVDIYLSKNINSFTRSHIQKFIKTGYLKINGRPNKSPSTKVKTYDELVLQVEEKENRKLLLSNVSLNIIHEDQDILIVNKPKGMVVHPGAGNYKNTLANALRYKYKNKLSDINGEFRPGIIHRIDKDTSGLLVVAKNNLAHSKIAKQFSDHSIKRKYQCLVWGVLRPLNGRINTLITRNKKNRKLMTVSDIAGKKAITNYRTLKVYNLKNIPKISFVECILETGRTHQIRVHLSYKGTSLLGDDKYGKKNIKFKKINENFFKILTNLEGQALHAKTLEFMHPTKNKPVCFKSNLPSEFKKILDLLNNLSS
tara:strand:+ start:67 stop:1047 length:981 start_codon:yes stop_codon:yes gene_type:complete